MAESESDYSSVLCNFCKKPAVNKKVKCANCSLIFHSSCYNKKTKKCCEKPSKINEEINAVDAPMEESYEINILKEANQNLNENIKLLQEKIDNLEIENVKLRRELAKNNVNGVVTLDDKCINAIREMVKENIESSWKSIIGKINNLDTKIGMLSKDTSGKNNFNKQKTYQETKQAAARKNIVEVSQLNTGSPKQISDLQGISDIKDNKSSQRSLEDEQRKLMNEIINLNANQVVHEPPICNTQVKHCGNVLEGQQKPVILNEIINSDKNEKINKTPRDSTQNNDDQNWQVQREKRRNKRNIGQSDEIDTKFRGARPKVWMYIYKVSQEVTEEDIKEFLQKKVGNKTECFIVKDLKETGRTKSFMVAADFKYKEELYKSSLWPQGVNYRRFDFNKYYEKHNTRNIILNENEGRPNSFLELAK